jgi:enoyl-[acyl-carrier protein] reductase II
LPRLALRVPIWKVLAGLVLEPQKIRLLANFGAATPRLKAATEQGDLERGMQFIGQSQGLIHDVCTADEMMQRLVHDIELQWQHIKQQALSLFFLQSNQQARGIPTTAT